MVEKDDLTKMELAIDKLDFKEAELSLDSAENEKELMTRVDSKLALILKNDEKGLQSLKNKILEYQQTSAKWKKFLKKPDCLEFFVKVSSVLWKEEVDIRIKELLNCDVVLALSSKRILEADNQFCKLQDLYNGCVASILTKKEKIVGISESVVFFGAYPKYQEIKKNIFDLINSLDLGAIERLEPTIPLTELNLLTHNVIREFDTTEKSFRMKMEKLSNACQAMVEAGVISEIQKTTLLTGYDDLIKESKTMDIDFVKPLFSFLEKFSPKKMAAYFHLYTKVAQNYHLAIEEMTKIRVNKQYTISMREKITLVIKNIQNDILDCTTFESFLMEPLQRGPRYLLLLNQLINSLTHESFKEVREALQFDSAVLRFLLFRFNESIH